MHGYAYPNYLKQLDPPSKIFAEGGSLDKAFAGEVPTRQTEWLWVGGRNSDAGGESQKISGSKLYCA